MDTLLQLFDAVPQIRAVKDWNYGPVHERHVRTCLLYTSDAADE